MQQNADHRHGLSLSLLALCAAGLVAAGCADGDHAAARPASASPKPTVRQFAGEQDLAAAVIADYDTAIRGADLGRLCKEILVLSRGYGTTEKGRQRRCVATSGDLAQEVKAMRGDKRFDLSVKRIRIHNARATAEVYVREAGQNRTELFYLQKRAGRWRLAARGPEVRSGSSGFAELDCRDRVSYAPAMGSVLASSMHTFVTLILGRMAPRALTLGSLYLVGVDYKARERVFEYRGAGTRRLARFRVREAMSSYALDNVELCPGANGLPRAR